MINIKLLKREPTNISITEEDWQKLCEIFFGEYTSVLTLFVDESEDTAWEALEAFSPTLYQELLEIAELAGGKCEISDEE